MKKLLIALLALCAPLCAEMFPKHFHIDMASQEGEWVLAKNQMRKGRYYEVWNRVDLADGVDAETIMIVSSPTSHGENPDMKRMMRNSMQQVKFLPGTRTSVHRESENEALFEWHTAGGQQSVVRLLVEPDMCHTISHMRKCKDKLTEEQIAERAAFLDSLKLTFSK